MSEIVFNDSVLYNMLKLEDFYTLRNNYLNDVIDNETRSTLSVWMLEVCEEEKCTRDVFYVAMNLFDRFMSSLKSSKFQINKSYLQLIGTTCLFISSKIRNQKPLNSLKLIEYTDNSITLADLLDLEIFILQKLKYDSDSISPNDFLEIFIQRLMIENNAQIDLIRKHFLAFTALCSTEIQFSFYPSSMIAYSCLLASINGLKNQTGLNAAQIDESLYQVLSQFTKIDHDNLDLLTEQINSLLNKSLPEEINQETKETKIEFEDDFEFNTEYQTNINKQKRSSTSSTVSSTSSFMDTYDYSNISSYYLTPPLANQLPLPNF